ncbi:hypothetical protein B484DRAFT_415595, partial [Ochromonadaceae sp. CCMP2298]
MADPDWESSFYQIVNRTKQNLNRINQRHAPPGSDVLAPRSNNENVREVRGSPLRKTSEWSQERSQERSLQERVAVLEAEAQRRADADARAGAGAGAAAGAAALADARIARLEKTVAALLAQIPTPTPTQEPDLQEQVTLLDERVGVALVGLEGSRRTLERMDGWVRQNESWRQELDERIAKLGGQVKANERRGWGGASGAGGDGLGGDGDGIGGGGGGLTSREQRLKDELRLEAQQAVAVSLSTWHSRVEAEMLGVQRQVALIKMGTAGAEGAGGTGGLSADEVRAVLAPSDLLLRGAVAEEVRGMETQLEQKMQQRLTLLLQEQVRSAEGRLQGGLQQGLRLMMAEVGGDEGDVLGGGGGGGGDVARAREAYRVRLLEAQRRSDKEVTALTLSVENLQETLDTLQQGAKKDAQSMRVLVQQLERRVEEGVKISADTVEAVGGRARGLERGVREGELKAQGRIAELKQEMVEYFADHTRNWDQDRSALERRMQVGERIAEDCLDRIKLSNSAVASYLTSSPEGRRYQRAAELVDILATEVQSLKGGVADAAVRVEEVCLWAAPAAGLEELGSRVGSLEPLLALGGEVAALEERVG